VCAAARVETKMPEQQATERDRSCGRLLKRRSTYKAIYDAPLVRKVLDESLVCTIAYFDEAKQQTYAVPTIFGKYITCWCFRIDCGREVSRVEHWADVERSAAARKGDSIYIQAKTRAASSLLQAVLSGTPVCVSTFLVRQALPTSRL
jgi:hypothetical protein